MSRKGTPAAAIRQLRSDEEAPRAAPARYKSQHGYVRLRWLVGPNSYVEVYEHRLVAGLPAGSHVHHKDGNKAHNDPGNLEVLTPLEHNRIHHPHRRYWRGPRLSARRWTEWDGLPGQAAFESRARRLRREESRRAFLIKLAELYNSGLRTTQIAAVVGLHPGRISVLLGRAGCKMRNRWDYRQPIDASLIAHWHESGIRAGEMLRRLGPGYGRRSLYRVFEELGLSRFGPGKPPVGAS